jgi:hypothetical protein
MSRASNGADMDVILSGGAAESRGLLPFGGNSGTLPALLVRRAGREEECPKAARSRNRIVGHPPAADAICV